MKLSKIALLAIRGLDFDAKKRLADTLVVSHGTLYRYLQDNDDNLTKAASLEFIRKETGLRDSEILEKETEEAQN